MSEIIRETLFDQTKDHADRFISLDFDRLRCEMMTLFESAAHAVQVAGYEQDDAVIDRFVICRVGGHDITMSVNYQSTHAAFESAMRKQLQQRKVEDIESDGVAIVALRVTATLERWSD